MKLGEAQKDLFPHNPSKEIGQEKGDTRTKINQEKTNYLKLILPLNSIHATHFVRERCFSVSLKTPQMNLSPREIESKIQTTQNGKYFQPENHNQIMNGNFYNILKSLAKALHGSVMFKLNHTVITTNPG